VNQETKTLAWLKAQRAALLGGPVAACAARVSIINDLMMRRQIAIGSDRQGQVWLDPAWGLWSPREDSVFECARDWCFLHEVDPNTGRTDSRSVRSRPISVAPCRQLTLRAFGVHKVYFVQESGMHAIKIGTAKNVDRRVKAMVVGTPHLLSVLAIIEGNREVESALHKRFAHARIRGEWFRATPDLLAFIDDLKRKVA